MAGWMHRIPFYFHGDERDYYRSHENLPQWLTDQIAADGRDEWPEYKKFSRNWTHGKREENSRCAMLISAGCYSPVHRVHIEMMDRAAAHLAGKGIIVVVGFISAAHDSYVARKLGAAGMRAKHRVELIRAAVKDHPFLECDTWESNRPDFHPLGAVIGRLSRHFRKTYFTQPMDTYYVCGADDLLERFGKLPLSPSDFSADDIICQIILISRSSVKNSDIPHGVNESNFIQGYVEDISSTLVRTRLASGEDVADLVPSGALELLRSLTGEDVYYGADAPAIAAKYLGPNKDL